MGGCEQVTWDFIKEQSDTAGIILRLIQLCICFLESLCQLTRHQWCLRKPWFFITLAALRILILRSVHLTTKYCFVVCFPAYSEEEHYFSDY